MITKKEMRRKFVGLCARLPVYGFKNEKKNNKRKRSGYMTCGSDEEFPPGIRGGYPS